MQSYILTHSAAADLTEIALYTEREWGSEQRVAYVMKLEEAADEIARGAGAYRHRDDLVPGMRVRLAGHHYIFCMPRDNQPAVIIAILHKQMDIISRINERLD